MSSDDVEIIGDSREIIDISDDNAEEDKKDVIILNYEEEDTIENNNSNICIVIKDEQEQITEIAQSNSKNNNLNDQITEVINLDSNFNNSDKTNTNSNVKRRRINRKLRNRNSCNKTDANNVRGIQERGKTLKASKTVVDNSNNILNSEMQNQDSDVCNNESINNIDSNSKESTTTSLDSAAANKQKRFNNYDFSKLKWLRPLKNISSPPHFQIVIIDRGHPNWRITNDKWLMIEKRLLEALNYEMLQSNDPTIGLFDGAKWTRGIKIVGCHNKNAVDFITKFIFNLDKLWHGAKLDVFPITHICRHIVKVYIPPPTLETQVILSLIRLQNGSLCCEDWEVVREHERGNGGGVDIWFSINDESFTDLCRLRGEIKYGINRIFFKPSH